MSEDEVRGFNTQVPTISGFFGAITFATMILLMQFSENVKYSEFLIPFTAIISFFFIISTISSAIDPSSAHLMSNKFRNFVKTCFLLGFYGLMAVIPALVYSFSETGAYILAGIEIITIIIYSILVPKI